jgi:hypothetical protein
MPILGLLVGAIFGLCFWLLLSFFRGIVGTTIDDQSRTVPNQGMLYSAFNALASGLVAAILVEVAGRLLFSAAWPDRPIMGLSVGLLAGLFNGGLACLRHFILRILLWRSGALPWNYPHFLDTVAECILLRKVGGGYIFLHRLLLDYLVGLRTNELAEQRNVTPLHSLTPTTLLPCGHEQRLNARFCSVCGADVLL